MYYSGDFGTRSWSSRRGNALATKDFWDGHYLNHLVAAADDGLMVQNPLSEFP